MKPERENYEIWLTDWLDGNLSQKQTEQFLAFLEANPDLREEAESISTTRLTSPNDNFTKKEDLIKSASDLELSQIEYLSVAYLEKDISAGQLEDLNHNIELNPGNKRLFESVRKVRLLPGDDPYNYKNKLRKLTRGEKIFRLSAIGLSAAAAIALIILSVIFVPRSLPVTNPGDALNTAPDSNTDKQVIIEENIYRPVPQVAVLAGNAKALRKEVPETASAKSVGETQTIAPADTDTFKRSLAVLKISRIPEVSLAVPVSAMTLNTLIASNNKFTAPAYADDNEERSRLGRFIARSFREKILKEHSPVDSPLKSYEIAQAGIEGLNKLLGWKMALVKTSDEKGELRSIYFSSRMLKFNAPVKKDEMAQ
jgi:hypothetical protein